MTEQGRFESRGTRPADLHAWNQLCAESTVLCTRVYDADTVDAEIERLERERETLMLRSVGAMEIAEGSEGWERVPIDCPMLGAVMKLRHERDHLLSTTRMLGETINRRNARDATRIDAIAVLDEIEDAFDPQIYQEQNKEEFDAPDDREYCVNITTKLWRKIGHALTDARCKPAGEVIAPTPPMDPYERAVRLAEEWQKNDETRQFLVDIIRLAEQIGGFDHETRWRPRPELSSATDPGLRAGCLSVGGSANTDPVGGRAKPQGESPSRHADRHRPGGATSERPAGDASNAGSGSPLPTDPDASSAEPSEDFFINAEGEIDFGAVEAEPQTDALPEPGAEPRRLTGHDEAIRRIVQRVREIEIICDEHGFDDAQWLNRELLDHDVPAPGGDS